jgi:outer membrane protein OmpA-like peptidoglycan-associated protein
MALYRYTSLCALSLALTLSSCSFNPFRPNDNHLTGSAEGAAIGGAAGLGISAVLGAPRTIIALATLGGAGIGYYATTLRFSEGGIRQAGGEVYVLGDYVAINIPTDSLFEPNTDELLPSAAYILNSAAAVLGRFPQDNIIISGNSSGFASDRTEHKLTERRARQVAGFLWSAGVNSFQGDNNTQRKLIYTGYANHFPIANHYHNASIRMNSRIQITAYPSNKDLALDKHDMIFNNIGALPASNHRFKEPKVFYPNFPAKNLPAEGLSMHKDYKGVMSGDYKGVMSQTPPAHRAVAPIENDPFYYHDDYNYKDDGSLANDANDAQTSPGSNVAKHGGYKGESDLKGEGPR